MGTIIGVGFRARVGKDEIARHLVKNHGFRQLAFADPLKRGCMEIFGLTHEQVYGDLKEVTDSFWSVSPRHILQKVGTDCLRDGFDRSIWVKAAHKQISLDPNANWILSDIRFINEAIAVKSWGGFVFNVERPGAKASNGIAGHASETEMERYEGWDHVVQNDGTLKDLHQSVDDVLSKLIVDINPT